MKTIKLGFGVFLLFASQQSFAACEIHYQNEINQIDTYLNSGKKISEKSKRAISTAIPATTVGGLILGNVNAIPGALGYETDKDLIGASTATIGMATIAGGLAISTEAFKGSSKKQLRRKKADYQTSLDLLKESKLGSGASLQETQKILNGFLDVKNSITVQEIADQIVDLDSKYDLCLEHEQALNYGPMAPKTMDNIAFSYGRFQCVTFLELFKNNQNVKFNRGKLRNFVARNCRSYRERYQIKF